MSQGKGKHVQGNENKLNTNLSVYYKMHAISWKQ